MAALSSALTYPLTLAHAWELLGLGSEATTLCVIGARAEASLPVTAWAELGELTGATVKLELTGPAAKATPQEHAHGPRRLSMVFPDTPMCYHQTSTGSALLHLARGGPGRATPLPTDLEAALPDAFVLFNPGFGEPGWERAWRPTVDALNVAGRPLLLTALSRADADRDATFWAGETVRGRGQLCVAAAALRQPVGVARARR